VLASVRQEEESLLFPLARALLSARLQGRPLMVAAAPRHLHRVPAWERFLRAARIPYVLRSSGPGPLKLPSVENAPRFIIWDTFGELRLLYSMADAVFTGGSLTPLGGQNFLEPLAAGIVPCIGPHWDNFFWVGDDILTAGLLELVPDGPAVQEALLGRLAAIVAAGGQPCQPSWTQAGETLRQSTRRRFDAWLAPRLGGAAQAARETGRWLKGEEKRPPAAGERGLQQTPGERF
jgi:3-deoxy-D-manno-octulosonic-acid transferase